MRHLVRHRAFIFTLEKDRSHSLYPFLGEFTCHMESAHCFDSETWISPPAVAASNGKYGPCTCDETYSTNTHLTTCYDMKSTHQVLCAYDKSQCPEDWYVIGRRFNSDHTIDEDKCNHMTPAYTNDDPHTQKEEENENHEQQSCGKHCLCNFHYQSRNRTVTAGSSVYGACYDPKSHNARCAVANTTCAPNEIWISPHGGQMRDKVCNCDDTYVGACMKGDDFSHCGIHADACDKEHTFVDARTLLTMDSINVDCRLCVNTWEDEEVCWMKLLLILVYCFGTSHFTV